MKRAIILFLSLMIFTQLSKAQTIASKENTKMLNNRISVAAGSAFDKFISQPALSVAYMDMINIFQYSIDYQYETRKVSGYPTASSHAIALKVGVHTKPVNNTFFFVSTGAALIFGEYPGRLLKESDMMGTHYSYWNESLVSYTDISVPIELGVHIGLTNNLGIQLRSNFYMQSRENTGALMAGIALAF